MRITKIILFLSIVFNCSLTVNGELLNIINTNPDATIYLNNEQFQGSLFSHEVLPGTHYLKVAVNDDVIFSDVINVPKGEITTIDTTRFVDVTDSEIPSLEVTAFELERIKKARGSFGFGFHLGSISGLSIKKYFGRFGIQLIGFGTTNTSDGDYESDEESDYAYNVRLLWNLKEKLVKTDRPVTLFTGIGYGFSNYENEIDQFDKEKIVYEAFLGTEYLSRIGYFTFVAAYRTLDEDYLTDEWVWNGNESYYSYTPTSKITSGITFNLGYHWYF